MKITVLDFENGIVIVRDFPSEHFEDAEEYITTELELSVDNCQWIITESLKLDIDL